MVETGFLTHVQESMVGLVQDLKSFDAISAGNLHETLDCIVLATTTLGGSLLDTRSTLKSELGLRTQWVKKQNSAQVRRQSAPQASLLAHAARDAWCSSEADKVKKVEEALMPMLNELYGKYGTRELPTSSKAEFMLAGCEGMGCQSGGNYSCLLRQAC